MTAPHWFQAQVRTYRRSLSRITSETVRPSARAFSCAAFHSSSSTRMVRCGVFGESGMSGHRHLHGTSRHQRVVGCRIELVQPSLDSLCDVGVGVALRVNGHGHGHGTHGSDRPRAELGRHGRADQRRVMGRVHEPVGLGCLVGVAVGDPNLLRHGDVDLGCEREVCPYALGVGLADGAVAGDSDAGGRCVHCLASRLGVYVHRTSSRMYTATRAFIHDLAKEPAA